MPAKTSRRRRVLRPRLRDLAPTALVALLLTTARTPGASAAVAQGSAPAPRVVTGSPGFEVNRGQTDPRVEFLSRGQGYTLFLASGEIVLALPAPVERPVDPRRGGTGAGAAGAGGSDWLRLRLVGARPRPVAIAEEPLPGKSNYFIGDDPERWLTGVERYARVRYREVYRGIDLVVRGADGRVEYDFEVAPGADPGRIRLAFAGARRPVIDRSGDLRLELAGGTLVQPAPIVYQETARGRRSVAGRYRLLGRDEVGFEIAGYDRKEALVIDPALIYSSYLGGGGNDRGFGIALDPAGNIYLVGDTNSDDFPRAAALQGTVGGQSDVFVSKFDPSGQTLLFSTYIGGSANDRGYGIGLDPAGNVYLTGETSSPNFPTAVPQQSAPGGAADAFVAGLDGSGTALVFSTYLGGAGNDRARAIAVDALGRVLVAGETASQNFPTVTPLQANPGGGNDGFVSLFVPPGPSLTLAFSTYLGGTRDDRVLGAVFGPVIQLTGETDSSDFPVVGPIQATRGGGRDAFVAHLDLPSLAFSTYLGGSNDERGNGIAVDASGNSIVIGETDSDDFPTVNPYQPAGAGGNDVFLARIDAATPSLLFSTYLGGGGNDRGYAVADDGRGGFFLTGETGSNNFPTAGAVQPTPGGGADVFLTRLEAAGSPPILLHSTYLGGGGNDRGRALAVGGCGVYLTGEAAANFPLQTPFQATLGGGSDAFLAFEGCPTAADLGIAKALAPGQDPTPAPGDPVVFVVRVANAGIAPIAAATVDDSLDPCLDPLGPAGTPCDPTVVQCAGAACATTSCTYTAAGFTLAGLDLDPGDSIVLTVTTRAGTTLGPCGNQATTSDADADVETARVTVDITAVARIVLRKTALPATVGTGDTSQFTIEIDNTAGAAPGNCTLNDPVSAGGCMTLRTCDLTTPLMAVLCSPPDFLSAPGFTVPAGATQIVRFTVEAGTVEGACDNTVTVTCNGMSAMATGRLTIANTVPSCPLLGGDVVFDPVGPPVNWPKVDPWVYTAPCSGGGEPILATVLVPTATDGDLTDPVTGATNSLRLYQVDCAASCMRELLVYKNPATGVVAVRLR